MPEIIPSQSMLTLEELQQITDISGPTLYSAEAKRIPRLTRDEQKAVIEKARQGDADARDAVVMNCLNWTMMKAAYIHAVASPEHLDLMDLVGVGYVEIMEKVDRSLEKDDPVIYLLSSAAYEMKSHAGFKDDLISRPRASTEALKKRDPFPVRTVTLEEKMYEISSVAPTETSYPSLHEAMNSLTPSCRRTIIESYGLNGQPAKTLQEIAKESNLKYSGVRDAHLRGRKQLAEKLTPLGKLRRSG